MDDSSLTLSAESDRVPENAPRHFQCSTCKRAFTRVDHLTRHVRAHTRQKPYVCPTCSKGFARVDLLKRHAAGHTADEPNKRRRQSTIRASRVIQACESCAQNHLRCEHDKPCSRCRNKNIVCRVPSAVDYSLDESMGTDSLGLDDDATQLESPSEDALLATQNAENSITSQDTASSDRIVHLTNSAIHQQPTRVDSTPASYFPDQALDMADHFLPDHLRNVPPFESSLSGTATPRGIMDFSFNWDIDLNDMDMGFLDQYNHDAPFGVETPSTEAPGTQRPIEISSEPPGDDVSVRHEAFKKSVWRYLPRSDRDFSAAEQPNLAFEDAGMTSNHRRSQLTARRAIQERLDRVTRDKLLALVLGTCSPANIGRIAGSFPTDELLDGLIQYFLTSPSLNAKAWFHLPTFSPSKLRTELLASIIAAGAVSTPDIPLRKLGFALHEASRARLAQSFEDDNSAIRDLQHVQTMLLQLEVGMWSGISRKMEIAESFLQPLVTMLRRGGRFRRSTWKEMALDYQDDGPVLEEKWRHWILQELYLRLVYRVFEHDRQSSMALLKPPLISYSELQMPLPHNDTLWNATSAQEWKSAYFSCHSTSISRPTADSLLDLDTLDYHESASTAYLYILWGMLWEYKQMETALGRLPTPQANNLILSSRHQELTRCFEHFRMASSSTLGPATTILVEVMLMYLNAPLDEILLFAGIEGQEEARRVYPSLQRWVTNVHSRQAVAHAGQVLRAASKLPRGLVRNFNAIAVYHAGLVFWGYGFLKRSVVDSSARQADVCLDSDNEIDIRRFITLDRGTPALNGPDGLLILISDMTGVMNKLIHLLKSNHDAVEGPCPPLVDNLLQLMEGLGCAIAS